MYDCENEEIYIPDEVIPWISEPIGKEPKEYKNNYAYYDKSIP